MSNSFLIPFGNNPVSTTVKTGTYTIPSGQYARIIVTDLSDAFEIDSVVAAEATAYVAAISTTSINTTYTNSGPYTMRGSFKNSDSASTVIGVFLPTDTSFVGPIYTNTGANAVTVDALIPPGAKIRVTTAAGGSTGAGVSLTSTNGPATFITWAKSGAVLDGTRYIVELYNNIS